MIKYDSIEQIYNLVKEVRHFCTKNNTPLPIISFEGTVKIHGTNGGVHIKENGKVIPQGRERVVSIGSDNYGFAAFVVKNEERFLDLWKKHWHGHNVYIYGEWAGKGIQKGVAVSQLDRQFIIFDVMVDEKYIENKPEYSCEEISVYNILKVPTYSVTIDFSYPEKSQEMLTNMLQGVEEECPWSKQFGVSGIGEGIVFKSIDYPVRLMFKIKGEKHANKSKSSKKVEIDFEKVANIHQLVLQLAPEWRLQQGYKELFSDQNPPNKQMIGSFLKWMAVDILKEEEKRIAESGFIWKEITPHLMTHCKNWFLNTIESLENI